MITLAHNTLFRKQAIAHVSRLQTTEARPVEDVCRTLLEIIRSRSASTGAHSEGVARIAGRIAEDLHLSPHDKRILQCAALVHDLGKLSVPAAVLDKRGPLSAAEWLSIRQHPTHTYQMLRGIPGMEAVAALARTHHERLDGSGYPQALSASDLSLSARILAVADVYDALSGHRSYRKDLSQTEVLKIMADQVPHALDERCFTSLCRILEAEGDPRSQATVGDHATVA